MVLHRQLVNAIGLEFVRFVWSLFGFGIGIIVALVQLSGQVPYSRIRLKIFSGVCNEVRSKCFKSW